MIVMPNGKAKTTNADLRLQDAADNYYVSQVEIKNFKEELLQCESEIREDIAIKMMGALPN